jgi:hypothetical protein
VQRKISFEKRKALESERQLKVVGTPCQRKKTRLNSMRHDRKLGQLLEALEKGYQR